MVTLESAKLPRAGSIPAAASKMASGLSWLRQISRSETQRDKTPTHRFSWLRQISRSERFRLPPPEWVSSISASFRAFALITFSRSSPPLSAHTLPRQPLFVRLSPYLFFRTSLCPSLFPHLPLPTSLFAPPFIHLSLLFFLLFPPHVIILVQIPICPQYASTFYVRREGGRERTGGNR